MPSPADLPESNWGLLHCRQILYQLSYQGNPTASEMCEEDLNKYSVYLTAFLIVPITSKFLFLVIPNEIS